MKLTFKYNLNKDVQNFFIASKSLGHNNQPSKRQLLYIKNFGEELTEENLKKFINAFIKKNNINVNEKIKEFQISWNKVNDEFFKRVKNIFKINLPCEKINAYLTVNDRCGYSIIDNLFFVSVGTNQPKRIVMHELFHFYTWYALGKELKDRNIGKQKYYDIKESLTIILNLEFGDLMECEDKGYIEHQELRKKIKEYWLKYKDIKKVVEKILIKF
ncbi:hypothetical protein KKA66_02485 [Patescibacteria group bacterium]|nr:hypothetical protein [Patescibacteria group bacterium]